MNKKIESKKPTIGLITIGQTPRSDMTPTIREFCPPDTIIIEKGGLDKKSDTETQKLAPKSGQATLVSRLENGDKAVISKEAILPIIQQKVDELNQMKVDLILLACTGKFKPFNSVIPVIYPDYLLNHVVKGIFHQGEIGAIIPLPEQSHDIKEKWGEAGFSITCRSSSPYNFDVREFKEAVSELDKLQVKAIILDCMGYTGNMKEIAQSYTSKPVLLSRNVIFSATAQLF